MNKNEIVNRAEDLLEECEGLMALAELNDEECGRINIDGVRFNTSDVAEVCRFILTGTR